MARKALTEKQLRFVEAYAGNARQAARQAGYADGPGIAKVGSELLANPLVQAALAERGKAVRDEDAALAAQTQELVFVTLTEERRVLARELVASRAARLAFFATVAVNPNAELAQRIKAVETIGKVQGDFVERVALEGSSSLEALVVAAVERARALEEEEEGVTSP